MEIDARLSADGVAVLSHDADLTRRGGVDRSVAELTAAELGRIPVAQGFAHYATECVPTLHQALRLIAGLSLGVVLEIKPDRGKEPEALQAVAGEMAVIPPEQVVFSSFSRRMLLEAQRTLPQIGRALNCGEITPDSYLRAQQTGSANIHCSAYNTASAIGEAAHAGYGVYCFTVNDTGQAQTLMAQGAHGVFSDRDLPV